MRRCSRSRSLRAGKRTLGLHHWSKKTDRLPHLYSQTPLLHAMRPPLTSSRRRPLSHNMMKSASAQRLYWCRGRLREWRATAPLPRSRRRNMLKTASSAELLTRSIWEGSILIELSHAASKAKNYWLCSKQHGRRGNVVVCSPTPHPRRTPRLFGGRRFAETLGSSEIF